MEFNEFYKELNFGLEEINLSVSTEQGKKFYEYTNLLLEWNKKINLTSITNVKDIIVKHYIDSLTVSSLIKDNSKIIDVGTGAGFPGIPLAIFRKDLNITLIDSLNKRIMFLEEIKNKLELSNVKIVHSRAEDLGKDKNYREQYDISVSRAVALLKVLIEYLVPFVKVGGQVLCMKGPNVEGEQIEAKNALEELGSSIQEVKNIKIKDMERKILIINKNSKTDNKYPRKAGTPSKQPL